jgi:predicted nucleic-acid-binding protein
MTALDTNVLVCIIINDDNAQAARATAFLRTQEQLFIPKTVLLELEWVLGSAYRIEPPMIASALHNVHRVANVEIEDDAAVTQALEWYEHGMDFADALHIATTGRERSFATFDNRLRRKVRQLGAGELAEI